MSPLPASLGRQRQFRLKNVPRKGSLPPILHILMGFYFRKSVGFGPFRLNFSKSGIGASFGVRGARVSSGPRGTYINVGRDGFYYRQKLDSPSGSSGSPQHNQDSSPTSGPEGNVGTADVANLVDSSSSELVHQINACAARPRYAPFVAIAFTVVALAYIAFIDNAQQSEMAISTTASQVVQAKMEGAEKARAAATVKGLKAKDKRIAEDKLLSSETQVAEAEKKAAAAKDALNRVTREINQANALMLFSASLARLP